MTPQQWEALQVGDTLMYIGSPHNIDYIGTLCKIVAISSNNLTLKILSPGKKGYCSWGNCSSISDGWRISAAFKFTLHSTTPASLSERINKKIKALDDNWAQSQAKKGNKYALLRL